MAMRNILVVIDATLDTAFDATAQARPPVVESLASLDAVKGIDFSPPVILCAASNAARARGAFLVTGDGDGSVIALDPAGTPILRSAVALAWRDLHASGAELMMLPAGAGLPATLPPFNPTATGPALTLEQFEATDARGVFRPMDAAWKTACADS